MAGVETVAVATRRTGMTDSVIQNDSTLQERLEIEMVQADLKERIAQTRERLKALRQSYKAAEERKWELFAARRQMTLDFTRSDAAA
jgi:hypothetical protein